jgi:hypothetical protein
VFGEIYIGSARPQAENIRGGGWISPWPGLDADGELIDERGDYVGNVMGLDAVECSDKLSLAQRRKFGRSRPPFTNRAPALGKRKIIPIHARTDRDQYLNKNVQSMVEFVEWRT